MVKSSLSCRPMFSLPDPDGETERDKWLAKASRAFLLDRIPIGTEVEIDAKFDGTDDHGSYIAPLSIDGFTRRSSRVRQLGRRSEEQAPQC